MTKQQDNIRELVIGFASEFAQVAARHVNELEDHFGPLVGRRKRGVPQKGEVGGIAFAFHGAGVLFESGDCIVDVDFAADSQGLVVDWFRLRRFIRQPIDEAVLRAAYFQCVAPTSPLPNEVLGRTFHWRR